jgi:integrase
MHTEKWGDSVQVGHSATKVVARPTVPKARSRVVGAAGALTVSEWGARWLDRRAREGVRAIGDDRARWRVHVEPTAWALAPLRDVTRSDAREWLAALSVKSSSNPTHKTRRPLSALTVRNVLNLVRRAFGDALEEGLIDVNPFTGLRVKRTRHATTSEPWTVLLPAEQKAIVPALVDSSRFLVMFALGTGLRQGEQWALRLVDLHLEVPDPYVLVRFGSPGQPTKGGRPRKVPIFGMALDALRSWLPVLEHTENPLGLVFPGRGGAHRSKGRPLGRAAWAIVERIAGRPVRWHDLRHTCATSLLAGWWGAKWSLDEVRAMLGHSSVKVTERYAHLVDDALTRAAQRMVRDEHADDSAVAGLRAGRGGDRHARGAREAPAGGARGQEPAERVSLVGAGCDGVRDDQRAGCGRLGAGAPRRRSVSVGDERKRGFGNMSTTTVDGVAAAEVEGARLADEASAGHLSSAVEQRFRNTETGPASEALPPPAPWCGAIAAGEFRSTETGPASEAHEGDDPARCPHPVCSLVEAARARDEARALRTAADSAWDPVAPDVFGPVLQAQAARSAAAAELLAAVNEPDAEARGLQPSVRPGAPDAVASELDRALGPAHAGMALRDVAAAAMRERDDLAEALRLAQESADLHLRDAMQLREERDAAQLQRDSWREDCKAAERFVREVGEKHRAALRSHEATAEKFIRERDEARRELVEVRNALVLERRRADEFAGLVREALHAPRERPAFEVGDRVYLPADRPDPGVVVEVHASTVTVEWPDGVRMTEIVDDVAPALAVSSRGEVTDDDEDEVPGLPRVSFTIDVGAETAEVPAAVEDVTDEDRGRAATFLAVLAAAPDWQAPSVVARAARHFAQARAAVVNREGAAWARVCNSVTDARLRQAREVLSEIDRAMIKGRAFLDAIAAAAGVRS